MLKDPVITALSLLRFIFIHCNFLFTNLLICDSLLDQKGLLGMSGRLGIDGVGFPGGGGAGLPNTGRLQ